MNPSPDNLVTASAPGKVILFGEHAINRGQAAIAASVGLYAKCAARLHSCYFFRSGPKEQTIDRSEILELGRTVENYRATDNFEAIRRLAAEDYFARRVYSGFRIRRIVARRARPRMAQRGALGFGLGLGVPRSSPW